MNDEPQSAVIQNFAPAVQEQLVSISRIPAGSIREIREHQKIYDEGYKHFRNIVESIVSGEHQLQLSLRLGDGTEKMVTVTTSSNASSESVFSSSSSVNATSTGHDLPISHPSSTEKQVTSTRPGGSESVPSYKINCEVKTVSALWDEWTLGRSGNYSVKELEEKWGTKWRRDDMKYFGIR